MPSIAEGTAVLATSQATLSSVQAAGETGGFGRGGS
jgi:hypothetical protein